jgi:putative protease
MAKVELLAPAKDLECGMTAINAGADAVYIGAGHFGARAKAGNPLHEIKALVEHAHAYWARVYVTVNTLLHDDELPRAVYLIHQLDELGVDAAIIQDAGLLECDLPPIALIASTQMHNHTPERVAFLERVGIQRVILARELSLAQIRDIRSRTSIELESFVHGALCVSYSGQCYMSYAIGGRSGNRGDCAQPCRRRYSLIDGEGNVLLSNLHLLSLRDLNLTAHLGDLLDAGVTSFKIEGRLKDRAYVANVVSWYRQHLDRELAERGWARASSGSSSAGFEPDPNKTFNRGYTTYFLTGRSQSPGALDSPKMVGEPAGTVAALQGQSFLLDAEIELHPGDGLCWFDTDQQLQGTVVNAVEPAPGGPRRIRVTPREMQGLRKGLSIFRNRDHAFLRQVERSQPVRKIAVSLRLECTSDGWTLHARDEDGVSVTATLEVELEPAVKPRMAEATTRRQLARTGDTPFVCQHLELGWDQPYFLPTAALNALRREALNRLLAARRAQHPRPGGTVERNDIAFPEDRLDYRGNVLNEKATAFYRRHGVSEIEPAAESGLDMGGRVVMRTRYCIQHQLGFCDGRDTTRRQQGPLYLLDEQGHRFPLQFDCARCEMQVLYESP